MLGGGTRGGPTLIRGKGCWVEDIDGKKYIDCTSQSWALYLGYANEDINAIVADHMKSLSHVHQGFDDCPGLPWRKSFHRSRRRELGRVSFTVGGGPAIESAMKIAVKNRPGAQEFLCLYDSYHGNTLGTMGSSWQSTMAGGTFMGPASFNRLTKQFIRVPNPYCYRCPLKLEKGRCGLMCLTMLRATIERGVNGPVAGMILEPLQASGGQVTFPIEYLQGVRSICSEFGIVMIYDEIQTYARIGTFFAAGYYGVVPDVIVLGKGLGAAFPSAQSSSGTDWRDSRRTPRSFIHLPTTRSPRSPSEAHRHAGKRCPCELPGNGRSHRRGSEGDAGGLCGHRRCPSGRIAHRRGAGERRR